jgi:hypothetical protein
LLIQFSTHGEGKQSIGGELPYIFPKDLLVTEVITLHTHPESSNNQMKEGAKEHKEHTYYNNKWCSLNPEEKSRWAAEA